MTNTVSFYVGTYSVRGSAGIYQVDLDLASGAMEIASHASAYDASYLAFSPDQRTLYAVEEGVSSDDLTPSVAAYEIVEGGALRLRNRLPIPGLSPCHIAASPDGRWLVTSNYSDGSNTVVAVDGGDGDGALLRVVHQSINGGEVGPHERQDAPHAHFAQIIDQSPTAARILSCDLGLDRLVALELNPATGILSVLADEGVSLPASVGPRHFAAHPTLPYLYVFGELDSAVYVFRKERATLNQLQAVSTLPKDFAGANLGAAIRVSPDGSVVTVSNRGRDSLASFRINENTGLLSPLGEVPSGGEWPRDFAYAGKSFLVAANERSDNLTAFRVDSNGAPTPIDLPAARLIVPSPACVAVPAGA